MTKVTTICFDMDGTIASLFSYPNWLELLRAENPTPYAEAKPMWDMEALADILNVLREKGYTIDIITWLSKDSSEEYKTATRNAKLEWLNRYNFPFDHFHGIAYGTTKADSIRKYHAEDETAILFDDNEKIRKGWHLGETVNPTTTNILDFLASLLD